MFRKILLGKAAFDRVQAMMFTPVNALPVGGEAASPEDVVVCCERPVAMPFKSAAPRRSRRGDAFGPTRNQTR